MIGQLLCCATKPLFFQGFHSTYTRLAVVIGELYILDRLYNVLWCEGAIDFCLFEQENLSPIYTRAAG